MKYSEMIQEAKSKGLTTEAMMWDSVEDVEMMLCKMKDSHPKEYWQFMRKQQRTSNAATAPTDGASRQTSPSQPPFQLLDASAMNG